MFGNIVRTYDIERTICDLIVDKEKIEPDVYSNSIRTYLKNENKNLKTLLYYADKMGILEKIRNLLEVYFE